MFGNSEKSEEHIRPSVKDLRDGIRIKTSRSGGPGGQNVNKVETRVQLFLDLESCKSLTDYQRTVIRNYFFGSSSEENEIIVSSDSSRSQVKNKELAYKKLDRIIGKAFERKRKRIATKSTRTSVEKRLKMKKGRGLIKQGRKPPSID